MYKSPIDIIYGEMQTQLEGEILKAVQRYGINVDKDELIRALQYDRAQYGKGYLDGEADATPKWIPVTERLPEHDGRYLCNVKYFSFPGSFYQAILEYDKHGFQEGHIYTDDVTHWMPLPEPPKGE